MRSLVCLAVFLVVLPACSGREDDKTDRLIKKNSPATSGTSETLKPKPLPEKGKTDPNAPPADDTPLSIYKTRAIRFIGMVSTGSIGPATEMFDAALSGALPPDKLEEVWAQVVKDNGAYKSHLKPRQETNPDKVRVTTELKFEKGEVDLKLIFAPAANDEPIIVGMYIAPVEQPGAPDDKKENKDLPAGHPGGLKKEPMKKPENIVERPLDIGPKDWIVSGVLTLPPGDGPFPVVVLVHGSGPLDRDSTVGPNKPFRDLAWGLATRNVASFRYDKRTMIHGKKIAESAAGANFTLREETVDDAISAVRKLREQPNVDKNRIVVLGHSLGGYAAPRILEAEPAIAGMVLLAGHARPLEELILEQMTYILNLDGKFTDDEKKRIEAIREQVDNVRRLKPGKEPKGELPFGLGAPYWLSLAAVKPLDTAKKNNKPTLVLQGGRDYQVTMADFAMWKQALKGAPKSMFKPYPNLNHLFAEGEGKSTPDEYMFPKAMPRYVFDDISSWVKKL